LEVPFAHSREHELIFLAVSWRQHEDISVFERLILERYRRRLQEFAVSGHKPKVLGLFSGGILGLVELPHLGVFLKTVRCTHHEPWVLY